MKLLSLFLVIALCANIPARASYDPFLFGPKEEVRVWCASEDDAAFSEGSILHSPMLERQSEAILSLYLCSARHGESAFDLKSESLYLTGCADGLKAVLPGKCFTGLSQSLLLRRLDYARALKNGGRLARLLNEYVLLSFDSKNFQSKSRAALLLERVRDLAARGRRQDASSLAAALLAQASARKLAFSTIETDYLKALTGSLSLETVPQTDGEGLHADLTFLQAEKLILVNLPAGKNMLLKAIELYEGLPPDKQYYAVPARLLAVELDLDPFAQLEKCMLALPVRDKLTRPNSELIAGQYLHIILSKLHRFETGKFEPKQLTEGDKTELRGLLYNLCAVAFLNKIDGHAEECGRLYRRCHYLADRFLPEDYNLMGMLSYDLAENAMWSESFDESSFYFARALESRRALKQDAPEAIDTSDMLGRVYISSWDTDRSIQHYLSTLAGLSRKKLDGFHGEEVDAKVLNPVFDSLKELYRQSGEQRKRQITAAIQGLADACVNGKYYDTALLADQALLSLRKEVDYPVDGGAVKALYWQMAWGQQLALHHKEAAYYYSQMIENYPDDSPQTRGMWYQSRALCHDLCGEFALARKDFEKALVHFRRALSQEKAADGRDYLTWAINDIRYNLVSANLVKARHFNDGIYSCYFDKGKMPLKVYLSSERRNGFGGALKEMMLDAIRQWTDVPGSPISVKYVDSLEDADIFVERVISYDDIPPGSAGRSSALYGKKKGEDTRELKRVHIRVFCLSYDGSGSPYLSSYAKTHLYTLFIHEFGHAIGLPHSPNGLDVMYWKAAALKPSSRDLETIRSIYSEKHKSD
ncbi:MAG: matrixin family metalloprotease [Candidatus Melainabacteria bacterium]|nr:matrixin family metalloprotease [Candidatus Melainabacteria bacterium]